MKGRTTLRWGLVLFGGGIAAVALRRRQLERETAGRIEALRSAATARRSDYQVGDVAALPAPVRRYFEAVLEEGQPPVHTVKLDQRGEFRLGGRDGAWKPMTATQQFTTEPPGFVWDADIAVFPRVPVRVVDAYEFGRGSLRAMLLSTLSVAEAGPSPAMNESELQRYLGEAVWFPTALLPGGDVAWDAIDDQSARATIEDRGNEASLVFHFDDDGLVNRVTTRERYRQESDSVAPWTGYFEDYECHSGMRIPTRAAVEWNLPDGDFPYWRARVTSVKHHYA
ncbi:DUF6920 family protein [Haloarcula sp. 1CSR25-25]|uniref:DUF6920 family protein n=1 Tax=Haloarcula sp. 1CSR25-25 TaxID=2862545 RepID=UPI002893A70F|nr:DUF6544 family protein [Haloarcula sp. 1CSR25-25]MDT3437242.1 hypothetical protein [Haloarcula sp. 1CSR25-25]